MNGVDNFAYDYIDDTDDFVKNYQNSTTYDKNDLPIEPVVKRISFCSMFSESTVPSEEVYRNIEEYKQKQRAAALESEQTKKSSVQYNLRVDKFVIVGGKLKSLFILIFLLKNFISNL